MANEGIEHNEWPIASLSLDDAVNAWFDESSRHSDDKGSKPRFVMVCGTPAGGKTRLRHDRYPQGSVTVDAGDIFGLFPNSEELDFPGEYEWMVDLIGTRVAKRAIEERRNIVTEVFGRDQTQIVALLELMKSSGYRTEVVGIQTSEERATEWNMSRGPRNISSYYTDRFNVRWLSEAALVQAAPEGGDL